MNFSEEDSLETRQLYEDSCGYIFMKVEGPRPKPAHLFYAHFLQALRYIETEGCPLAAVSFKAESPRGQFMINPRNAKNLKLGQFAGTVVHEIQHVLLGHTLEQDLMREYPTLTNVAMDMEVNQNTVREGYDLPEGKGILADHPEHDVKLATLENVYQSFLEKGIPVEKPNPDEVWTYYLNWLIQAMAQAKNQQQSQEQQDSEQEQQEEKQQPPNLVDQLMQDLEEMAPGHEEWGGEGLTHEEKQLVERYVAEAAKEASESSGELPGTLGEAVKKLIKKLTPEVDWSHYVSDFLAGTGRLSPYIRRSRLNRNGYPGFLSLRPERAVGVVMDVSTSIKDEDSGRFLAEVVSLMELYRMDVFVQEVSYKATRPIWSLREEGVKNEYERVGRGGTNLRPGIEIFLDHTYGGGEYPVGGIIVFSDGRLPAKSIVRPEECPLPLLWVFTDKTANPFQGQNVAGRVIHFNRKGAGR